MSGRCIKSPDIRNHRTFVVPAMEDSFRVRIDKTFGSLTSSPSPSPSSSAQLSSLWCLTDEEIEKNEWNREREVSEPRPGPFRSNSFVDSLTQEKKSTDSHAQLEKDLDELDVDDDGEADGQEEERRSSRAQKPEEYNEEEWEIKSSIGLDCTLDFEEEEDGYDKVAVGKEKKGDQLYMQHVNDYKTEADDWDTLPMSLKDLARDPRANHIAAKLRLKEDAEAAKKMNSLHVSEGSQDNQFMSPSEDGVALRASEIKEAYLMSEDNWSQSLYKTKPKVSESDDNNSLSLSETRQSLLATVEKAPVGTLDDGGLKPILKRKDNQTDPKLQKRVRFSSDCYRDQCTGEGDKGSAMETFSADGNKVEANYPSGIPDYMRYPSKYTHYTFDSGEMDEESNRKAYMDFLNIIKSRKESEEHGPVELPRSVTFVPKRKPAVETDLRQNNIGMGSEGKRGVMAVDSVDDDEVCSMEEDDGSETTVNVNIRRDMQRSSRQYRHKAEEDLDEC